MIYAIVGAGGKTGLLKEMADRFRRDSKSVFITTTTHMLIEEDTLLTDDTQVILNSLRETGYAFAGVPEGVKIRALPEPVYAAVCQAADAVLVEADGSNHMPLKYPNASEPVIPDNADEILVVCGLHGLDKTVRDSCHRPELVTQHLQIPEDTLITPHHIYRLVMEGYVRPLREKYPGKKITVVPRHDGSLYHRTVASMLMAEQDPGLIRKEWFCPQPHLIICGGGHVARDVAALAAHLDFSVTVLDDRADLVTAERFPTADRIICDSYENLGHYLEDGAYYVVVTPDHKADLQCVCKILPTKYTYLGMIGSKKKVAATFQNLRNAGFEEERIQTIFAPIGLSIGAVTPAEIAVSILAQLIQEKNKHHIASADRSLLEVTKPGVLCIITEKHGSAPRGTGSMMFVGDDFTLGSIGGGEPEYLAIRHAREHAQFSVRELVLNKTSTNGLDMICGGSIKVVFIPVK